MQTFLPYADFSESAKVIDNVRLGNQCYRECVTLFRGSWPNHPASKMWRGYERALAKYGLALAQEMGKRHKPDGSLKWRPEVVDRWVGFWRNEVDTLPDTGNPPWLGNEDFHRSHQSNLLRKDFDHYSKFFVDIPDNLEYIWP